MPFIGCSFRCRELDFERRVELSLTFIAIAVIGIWAAQQRTFRPSALTLPLTPIGSDGPHAFHKSRAGSGTARRTGFEPERMDLKDA